MIIVLHLKAYPRHFACAFSDNLGNTYSIASFLLAVSKCLQKLFGLAGWLCSFLWEQIPFLNHLNFICSENQNYIRKETFIVLQQAEKIKNAS